MLPGKAAKTFNAYCPNFFEVVTVKASPKVSTTATPKLFRDDA